MAKERYYGANDRLDRLNAFIGKMLGDIGGAMSVPTVRIGFRLGLFDALAQAPAMSPSILPMNAFSRS